MMMRIRFLFIVMLMILVHSCANEPSTDAETTEENTVTTREPEEMMPSFMIVDETSARIDLASLKGKKVFLNLWATWCPPCRAEMPSIQKLYNSTDRNKSVFVMLSLDEDFQSAKFYRSKEKFTFPIYAPAQNMPELFNVPGIPATFIFDEQGRLIHRRDGSSNYNTDEYRELLK